MRSALALVLASSVALAQSSDKKLNEFANQVRAERKRLGLDKKNERFPTPEVKFAGTAAGDGLSGVVCPDQGLVVNLDGVPNKSLVLPRSDDLQVSKESWSGTRWTGTLTPRKGAAPQAFALDVVFATTGQQTSAGRFLLGCSYTLVFHVEDATFTTKVNLRASRQDVTGEWKKAGKAMGQRTYQLTVRERSLDLQAAPEAADQERLMKAMESMLSSPKMKALDARLTAVSKKMEACGKVAPEKMGACFAPHQVEMEKISAERAVLQAEADKASAPAVGCQQLDATIDGKGEATGCAGHGLQDRVPLTWSWTSP